MKIDILKVGLYQTNCYFLRKDGKLLIVDPGDEFHKIKQNIGNDKLLGILITHSHFDHVGALNDLVDEYSVPVYKYENLEEKEYDVDTFKFEVIYMPGHKEDLVVFYFKEEKIMIVGDFIFKESIGRTDFEGGSDIQMMESLNKIKIYPKDITLLPGHGDITTLGYELENNYYLK